MDTLGYLGQGFGIALTPYNPGTALCGTLIGTIVGLLPGLGPINGVALLIPVAFALGLPPESALILLAAVYLGCEHGGRISSILLNIPGEASAVMTTLDGYPLSAILLGFILGGLMEQNLRRALSISNGDIGILFASPVTWPAWALILVMIALPFWRAWRKR